MICQKHFLVRNICWLTYYVPCQYVLVFSAFPDVFSWFSRFPFPCHLGGLSGAFILATLSISLWVFQWLSGFQTSVFSWHVQGIFIVFLKEFWWYFSYFVDNNVLQLFLKLFFSGCPGNCVALFSKTRSWLLPISVSSVCLLSKSHRYKITLALYETVNFCF